MRWLMQINAFKERGVMEKLHPFSNKKEELYAGSKAKENFQGNRKRYGF